MQTIQSFLKYLQYEKRYSDHTIVSYRNDLTQFYIFLTDNNLADSLHFVDYKTVRYWIASLMESGMVVNSVRRKLTTLKSFYKYLQREGIIEKNPVDKVIPPKGSKKLPVFIEQGQINRLLDNYEFGDGFEGTRNRLIIELFYATGIRRAELINLRIHDLNKEELSLKVLGKRNKERIIPFNKYLVSLINDYIDQRNKLEVIAQPEYFFLSKKGNKIYEKLVYRIVKGYLELVTTIEKKSPHLLRHTFATHMLNNGADLNAIKELLGHANLAATQVYTHNTFEKLKEIYKKAHPRA